MSSFRLWGLIFGAIGFGGLAVIKLFDIREAKKAERKNADCIHGIEHGLQLRCSGVWYQQAWVSSADPEICMDPKGRRYTSNESKITCEKCRAM